MALEMGWDCTTTLKPHTTAVAANMRKRMTSISGEERHHEAGDQKVEDGHGEHKLPSEGHQLIVAEARQRAANPDKKEQQCSGLGRKPEQGKQRSLQGGDQKHGGEQKEDHSYNR